MCLVSQNGWERKKGEGPKCSLAPKTPHPLEVCVVFVALECRDEEWVVYQSYIVMLNGWCLVVYPLVSQGTFGPLYDSGCVLTEEVDTWDGGCRVVMLSACICLSLLCMFFGLDESADLSGGDKGCMTRQLFTDTGPCLWSHFSDISRFNKRAIHLSSTNWSGKTRTTFCLISNPFWLHWVRLKC